MVSQVSPDTGTTQLSYDAAGNLLSQTDARSVTTTYSYDALNRLTDIFYPDPSLDVAFEYDQGTNGVGRLTRMQDGAGTTDYVYDQRGNLIRATRTAGALVTVTEYAYDTADQLVTLTYPSGYQVHYGHDLQGRVISATLERPDGSTQVLADNITNLPFGPVESLSYGNGLQLTRSYDLDYRLTDQDIPGILESAYTFDPVDNITGWSDLLDAGRDQLFGYDTLDRLDSADGPYGVLGYSYDAVGNRLSLTTDGVSEDYAYAPDSNRLTEITGQTAFSYDPAGNLIQADAATWTYDDHNRPVSYSAPGVTASYAYNGNGERVTKTVDGVTTHFRYVAGQLIGEYDDTGAAIREYVYLNGQPLAVLAAGSGGGGTPPPPPPAIDFNAVTLSSYSSGQDVSGGASVSTDGTTLTLTGNTWKKLNLNYTITADTVLEFEFYSTSQGEIHGIGFDNDTSPSSNTSFKAYGSQNWGISVLSGYASGTWQTVQVRVGDHFTGTFPDLVFIMDDDAAAAGESQFRNVRVYEDTTGSGAGSGSGTVTSIDFNAHSLTPYSSGQDLSGGASVSADGTTLTLTGNTWKKINLDYTVTADTLLEFDFYSASQGEVHGIGFDNDTNPSSNTSFKVYGSQDWGISALSGYTSGTWQSVQIPVGDHFTGAFPDLVFIMDDDAAAAGESQFRHVRLTEGTAPPPPPASGETEVHFAHTDHLGAIVKLTDETGAITWDADRMPFGRLALQTEAVELPLRFPGQYFDAESGGYYNYFRDYDPATGRYIQSDPIGLGGGLNTYAYAEGNPLSRIDSLGLSATTAWGNLGLGAGDSGVAAAAGSRALTGYLGLVGIAIGGLLPSSLADGTLPDPYEQCPPDCTEILAQIKAHITGMKKKYFDMQMDKYDQFNDSGLGFGTWGGHRTRYEGLRTGLRRLITRALQQGCPIPDEAWRWLNTPAPKSPNR